MANGNPVASRTVTARDGWRWSFTGLPKYENGVLIRYSIAEDPVPNYTAQVNGYNVTNRYDAVAVEIRGEKYVDGENAPDSEFVFVLTPMAADNPMPAGQSGEAIATISGSGEFRFGPISFTKPGVYQYTVSERLGDAPGYTYDAAIYTVNVEVSRDGQALKAVVTYMKDGAQAHGLRFTNRYATGAFRTGCLLYTSPTSRFPRLALWPFRCPHSRPTALP